MIQLINASRVTRLNGQQASHFCEYNMHFVNSPEDLVQVVRNDRTDLWNLNHLITADGYANPPDRYRESFSQIVNDFLSLLASTASIN